MTYRESPKIALVTDWLTTPGGAEKVLLELHRLYPSAPIYTSQYRPKKIDWFSGATVRTGWLNLFPAALRKVLGPLRQLYFSHLDLTSYDLVISVTGAEAKSVKAGTHLCYCHAPTQYYWGKYDDYLKNPGFGFLSPIIRLFFKALVGPLRRADFRSASRPTQFITISSYSAAEIQKYYHRDSVIIAPPVDIHRFSTDFSTEFSTKNPDLSTPKHNFSTTFPQPKPSFPQANPPELPQDYFVIACRQVTWKRVDLAIEACTITGNPLLVIGDGPEHQRLVKLAGNNKNIFFLPWQDSKSLAKYYQNAKAFLFPSLEPFGIAPVEALAAGCPVIAYHKGGSEDFITAGKNGLFFSEQTAASLATAITKFSKLHLSRQAIKASAHPLSAGQFDQKITNLVQETLKNAK